MMRSLLTWAAQTASTYDPELRRAYTRCKRKKSLEYMVGGSKYWWDSNTIMRIEKGDRGSLTYLYARRGNCAVVLGSLIRSGCLTRGGGKSIRRVQIDEKERPCSQSLGFSR
jgi:hypothetical protein